MMLLAHGTTASHAARVEEEGFHPGTYFLKMHPDPKLAIVGAAGFALRDHPLTGRCIELYCRQDLLVAPFRESLQRSAERYMQRKSDDRGPGLIYIVEAASEALAQEEGLLRAVFIPGEVISRERILAAAIRRRLTIDTLAFPHAEPLRIPDHDPLARRILNTFYSRILRML